MICSPTGVSKQKIAVLGMDRLTQEPRMYNEEMEEMEVAEESKKDELK